MKNKQNNINDIVIKRWIRFQLSKINAIDSEYTTKHMISQIDLSLGFINKENNMDKIYHNYLLGENIWYMIESKDFYMNLPRDLFPELFIEKIKPKKDQTNDSKITTLNNDMPGFFNFDSGYQLNEEMFPQFKKEYIKYTKRYILLREFRKWLLEYGLKTPKVDLISINNINSQDQFDYDLILMTIRNYLIDFKETNKLNVTEYNKLFALLRDYFKEGKKSNLTAPVVVSYGSKGKLAYALGEIYREIVEKTPSYEYLMLGKKNITLFGGEDIDSKPLQKTNLYKYYSQDPRKH